MKRIEATQAQLRLLARAAEPADSREPGEGVSRQALEQALPPQLLERYDTLRRQGCTPALATLEAYGTCSGCHIRLPTMFTSKARLAKAVYSCPYCQRLLQVPEPVAVAEAPAAASKPAGRRGPVRDPREGGRVRA